MFMSVFDPGDNSGRVTIWNMLPVTMEAAEVDNSIPKMFCQMDNHLGGL
jgi:protein HIRA/HIR1